MMWGSFGGWEVMFLGLKVDCDSNSRLVVDEDDNGEFSLERVNPSTAELFVYTFQLIEAGIANAKSRFKWQKYYI